ncbi:hypothetical protein PsYK624_050190 [Phanerochaete sordida]|uniref:Uncharacterized protein n=1 Tax=Phanerochaete sordida TaxID=48140 RepID=A0A9P3LAY8_9APHY|nr:hypothetical protein PsYK624_050190 [Phanerochaete sordida]
MRAKTSTRGRLWRTAHDALGEPEAQEEEEARAVRAPGRGRRRARGRARSAPGAPRRTSFAGHRVDYLPSSYETSERAALPHADVEPLVIRLVVAPMVLSSGTSIPRLKACIRLQAA